MLGIRRRLSWILAGWLAFQLAGIVAPVVLSAAGHSAGDSLCECPGTEPGAACPMHHGQAPRHDDANRCRLENTCAPTDAALLSLAGGIGVLPQSMSAEIQAVEASVGATGSILITRTELPDSPPPRS